MRRTALAAFLLMATNVLGAPQDVDDLKVLTETSGEPAPGQRLYVYLTDQARKHFDARRAALAALKTPADVARRQAELRVKFREALGEMPSEKTPLNARTIGREAKDGYILERVIFESRPGHHVTAAFYLPEGDAPFPGVLVPCGHSANGKAAETYQRISILLAKNGLAALCYDPIGQGERVQLLDEQAKPAINGSTTEHTMVGIGAWLVGRSVAGYRVWDGVRALDYLASRPEVDPERLGCTGNSGGGTLTAYLMAFDDRIAAAAPSCYITSLERLFATIGPQDAEQNLTGQVALGIEHADFVTMRLPKPTLLCVGTQDFFDIDGSWTAFREAKEIYGIVEQGERVDIFESNEPHGFTHPRRQAAMRWMRRWLLGKDDSPTETDFPIATDQELQATSTGQVLSAFKDEVSAFELNARKASELAESRRSMDLPTLRAEIMKRLAVPEKFPQAIVTGQDRRLSRDGYSIDRWALNTEPGMTIPLLLFRPEVPHADQPTIVYVGADRSLMAPGGPIETLVRSGRVVVIVEPRGTGETRPTPPGQSGYGHGPFGDDEREAFLALHLDRPLLGQRVFDVLQALSAAVPSNGRIRLVGIGQGGPIALHAAVLRDAVTEVELDGSILSWTDVITTPISRGQLASVVPGVLETYDLPDLAAALAPRPFTLRAPVNPSGQPVAKAAASKAYAGVSKRYQELGAADLFQIEP
jgi:cephalosporin-C deacetylase-like acetyl esterase